MRPSSRMVLCMLFLLLDSQLNAAEQECYCPQIKYQRAVVTLNNYSSSTGQFWFKVKQESYYLNPEIIIENISLGDSARLFLFNDIQCDSITQTPLLDRHVGSECSILMRAYSPGTYYLLLETSYDQRGAFSVKYSGDHAADGCYYEVNKDNSLSNPHKLSEFVLDVNKCFNSCNKYISSSGSEDIIINDLNSAFKWYSIDDTRNAAFIDVTANSFSGDFQLIIAHKSIRKIESLQNVHSNVGHANIGYLPIPMGDPLFIGIRPLEGTDIDFNLCCRLRSYDDSCIDYLTEGDTLYPVATSLGSDVSGPYMEGEEILFVYEIVQWRPINFSYLHSIIPSFSGPWELSMDTVRVDSVNPWSLGNDEGIFDYWTWRSSDTSILYSSLNDRNMGAGWYMTGGGRTRNFDLPKMNQGQFMDPYDTPPTPFLKLHFTMKVDDTLDCQTINECEVSIQANADNVSGFNLSVGCTNDAEVYQCTTICCPGMPFVRLVDSSICDYESIALEVKGLEDGVAHFSAEGLIPRSEVNNGENPFLIKIGLNELKSYDSEFVYNYRDLCLDTVPLDFIVAPLPSIELGNDIFQCEFDPVVVTNKATNYDQRIQYSWEGNHTSVRSSDQSTDILIVDEIAHGGVINLKGVNQYGCENEDDIRIDAIESVCGKLRNIELCFSDLDSIIELSLPQNRDCLISVVNPDGIRSFGPSLVLSSFGEYEVTYLCETECGCQAKFIVDEFQKYDTVYLGIGSGDLYSAPSDLSLTRSTLHDDEICDYEKEVIYIQDAQITYDNILAQQIVVFPNPSKGDVIIENKGAVTIKYKIVDVDSDNSDGWIELASHHSNQVRNLSSGIYYVNIKIDGKNEVIKLVVRE